MPLVHPAGDHVIPSAFRCGFDQHGRLHIGEAFAVKEVPCAFRHLVAECQVLLHMRFSQVEKTVFQPQVFTYVVVILDIDRRGLCFGVNGQSVAEQFHFAGGQVLVLGFPFPDRTGHADDELAPEPVRFLKGCRVVILVEDDLHDPGLVSQVAEDQPPEVSSFLDPSVQGRPSAGIPDPEISAHICPFHYAAHISKSSYSCSVSSAERVICSPVSMSFTLNVPAATSSSPMMTAFFAPIRLAYLN